MFLKQVTIFLSIACIVSNYVVRGTERPESYVLYHIIKHELQSERNYLIAEGIIGGYYLSRPSAGWEKFKSYHGLRYDLEKILSSSPDHLVERQLDFIQIVRPEKTVEILSQPRTKTFENIHRILSSSGTLYCEINSSMDSGGVFDNQVFVLSTLFNTVSVEKWGADDEKYVLIASNKIIAPSVLEDEKLYPKTAVKEEYLIAKGITAGYYLAESAGWEKYKSEIPMFTDDIGGILMEPVEREFDFIQIVDPEKTVEILDRMYPHPTTKAIENIHRMLSSTGTLFCDMRARILTGSVQQLGVFSNQMFVLQTLFDNVWVDQWGTLCASNKKVIERSKDEEQ